MNEEDIGKRSSDIHYPAIILLLVWGIGQLYLYYKTESLSVEYNDTIIQYNQELSSKVDSLKKADSVEFVEIIDKMKNEGEKPKSIELVTEHYFNKIYPNDNPVTNLFGDTVYFKLKSDEVVANIQSRQDRTEEQIANFFGHKIYDGELVIFYVIFLILTYPIRLIIYLIIWAIKALRS